MSQQCMDPIVGKILAGWRYDISGLAVEMRGDYEEHFAGCEHCRSRQRLHRIIDISLITLASVSAGVFLLAFGVIRHFGPRHAFWLERSEEHTSELQSRLHLVCRLLLEKKKKNNHTSIHRRTTAIKPQPKH